MTLDASTLKKWRELCDKAAPGPWTIYRRDDHCGLIKYDVENEKMQQVCFGQYDDVLKNNKQTSAFIAEARSALPMLLDAYEKLQGENAELLENLNEAAQINDKHYKLVDKHIKENARLKEAVTKVLRILAVDHKGMRWEDEQSWNAINEVCCEVMK